MRARGLLSQFSIRRAAARDAAGPRPQDAGAPIRGLLVMTILLLSLAACEREERRFQDRPAPGQRPSMKRLVSLAPGPHTPDLPMRNPYERNAWAVSEGKRLFTWYNCSGCHANGGGGMGPALMDEKWIYGSQPENIFATIEEGRPNGMPSFRGRIPEQQVWQLVAFVQSLSGGVRRDAANGRPDDMQVHKQEQALPHLEPERAPAIHP
jgi:cytochrome c oxidase cbb3-type subunit 3